MVGRQWRSAWPAANWLGAPRPRPPRRIHRAAPGLRASADPVNGSDLTVLNRLFTDAHPARDGHVGRVSGTGGAQRPPAGILADFIAPRELRGTTAPTPARPVRRRPVRFGRRPDRYRSAVLTEKIIRSIMWPVSACDDLSTRASRYQRPRHHRTTSNPSTRAALRVLNGQSVYGESYRRSSRTTCIHRRERC